MTQSQKEELKESIKEQIKHIGEENEKLRVPPMSSYNTKPQRNKKFDNVKNMLN